MPNQSASQIMEEISKELADSVGPIERLIIECSKTLYDERSEEGKRISDAADAIIHELRNSWGPTADPHWVDGLLPGRGYDNESDEFDALFALFHRPGIWGYLRLRAKPMGAQGIEYLKLLLGVIKDKEPS